MRTPLAPLCLAVLFTTTAFAQAANPVAATDPGLRTVEFANSSPTGTPPQNGLWSPDGKRFTYIATDATVGQPGDIVQVDAATGKPSVLASQEQLSKLSSADVNEKDQDHRNRYKMSSFLWADDGQHLILDNGGKLWLYNITDGTGTLVVDTGAGSGDDPKFSPDAKLVSYIRNHNLYVHRVADAKNGKETALTSTTPDTLLNGEVDWVYLEELDVRSNYFWSPDSSAIAYLEADESKVPIYPITDEIPTHPTTDMQRYPQPGDPNPAVRVGVIPAKGGKTKWIDLPFSPGNDYIPRFGWIDAHTVWVETLTRDQQHRNLYFADAHSGKSQLVFSDTDDKYLNFKYDITFLPHGRFLTLSWRDGYTNIYLYQFDEQHPLDKPAALARQLTTGQYEVEEIKHVSDSAVLYTSTEGSPLENNLWTVSLDGTGKRQLTLSHGHHDITASPDGIHFSDEFSTSATPPVSSLCAIGDGGPSCNAFWHSKPVPPATGVTATSLTFTAADGKTTLYGTLFLPANTAEAASVPLILNPYGGPTLDAGVRNRWAASSFFNELLVQHGFAILAVDARGSGGRGRDFQQAAYRNFGPVQLSDQLAALDQSLAKYSQLDPKRIGWWGWSWGGSFTLYAMSHTEGRVRAGVAVAPVTDWRNYDSIYTERYLGLPSASADVYKNNSPITAAASLKGHLLIALGTGDDNVHPANSIQYLEPLIEAGIPYDLQLFPRKTHSIAGPTARNELYHRILWHFETYLK
ncbi:MAG TPA: alpha/beta fold hydrolase [Granulicella sp.]